MSDYAGQTFKQVAWKLRIHRPGKPDLMSERPRQNGLFVDGDTLLTIGEDYIIDVDSLLKAGLLAQYTAPKKKAAKEVAFGKSSSFNDPYLV